MATGEKSISQKFCISNRAVSGLNSIPTGYCIQALATRIHKADKLEPTATIQVDNSVGECAQIVCTAVEESAIFTAVIGAATLSDAVDGDIASYTGAGSTVDAGNGNLGNLQLNISADAVWAMLFTVKML